MKLGTDRILGTTGPFPSPPIFYSLYSIASSSIHSTSRIEAAGAINELFLPWNNLLTYQFMQNQQQFNRTVVPAFFWQFFSLVGGFWAMFTSISNWLLKKYMGFQFRKSAIKKLYTYQRVRKADLSGRPSA